MRELSIIVTGGETGLGKHIVDRLRADGHNVVIFDIRNGDDVSAPERSPWLHELSEVDVLINCAGINLNCWFEELNWDDWDRVMDVNAKGIWRMTQAVLPQLVSSKGTVINITSNAAHMPMTSSLAYNASKAAADMVTKQMAHELTPRHGMTIFGIAPNKLRGTGMSKDIEDSVWRIRGWTPEFAKEYQKKSLMKGLETEPSAIADYIAYLLGDPARYTHMSGTIVPFGK